MSRSLVLKQTVVVIASLLAAAVGQQLTLVAVNSCGPTNEVSLTDIEMTFVLSFMSLFPTFSYGKSYYQANSSLEYSMTLDVEVDGLFPTYVPSFRTYPLKWTDMPSLGVNVTVTAYGLTSSLEAIDVCQNVTCPLSTTGTSSASRYITSPPRLTLLQQYQDTKILANLWPSPKPCGLSL
jgi:hypothetical protein